MSDPITFDSASPRFGMPLLFAGQVQKEAFVNESLSLLDGLIHCAIAGEAASPPTTPVDGDTWMIASTPTGEWAERAGQLALRQAGQWLYVTPRDGLRVLDRATGQEVRRAAGTWRRPVTPPLPSGGSVVDSEARAALADVVTALREAGIFAL